MQSQRFIERLLYRIKFCAHFCLSIVTVWFIIFIAVAKRRWKDSRNALFPSRIGLIFGRLLGLTVVVDDRHKVDVAESFVVVMNHQSCLDIIIISRMCLLLGNLAPVVKKLLLIPPFGPAVIVSDGLIIDRKKGTSAIKSLNEKSESLKLKKRNILLFPEGTRNSSQKLLPFKKGAFYMSVKAEMRILPVVVQKYPFIDHDKKIFGRGEVKVKILNPMEKFELESLDEFIARVYDEMNSHYQEMNGKAA